MVKFRKSVPITLCVSPEFKDRIQEKADKIGISNQEWIRRVIARDLNNGE